ncbi:uncharacterized protein BYT42DRAFT_647849 [Radiomyces spectabilis]|uniref:uncharacterized protein n=1 Tax=Radiomyces spectabilis TaxID=64574 RepID=UPI00221F8255|nr:uncharacterized protein BYT42DRAFT_647849 [Radiomyces spectabilis]KAI8370625.1 hypothetical protein BYT42DRAFT_647849 [Radiomyces spectabilis]
MFMSGTSLADLDPSVTQPPSTAMSPATTSNEIDEGSSSLITSKSSSTLPLTGNSKRLPLRKRMSKDVQPHLPPALKWQPVEISDSPLRTPYPTPSPQKIEIIPLHQLHHETYQEMAFHSSLDTKTNPPNHPQLVETHDIHEKTVISTPIPTLPPSTTHVPRPPPALPLNDNAPKVKPLKKVQHWITKGKHRENEPAAVTKPATGEVGTSPSFREDPPLKKPRLDDLTTMPSGRPTIHPTPPLSSPEVPVNTPPPPSSFPRPCPPLSNRAINNTLYCICRKPYDIPRFMIACDRCDQWFHGECIGISEKQGEFIDLYFCSGCAKVTGKQTSWKPKCKNPACQKPSRTGKNYTQRSKYCSDLCGVQVARARLELAEIKRRGTSIGEVAQRPIELSRIIQLSKNRLNSYADNDDRQRLLRVRDERKRAKEAINTNDRKTSFLKMIIQKNSENPPVCGFDSRLSWMEDVWMQVVQIHDDATVALKDKEVPCFTVCSQTGRCNKHANWQKLKAMELEHEREEQFAILALLMEERKQILARMKKRREHGDITEALINGTISHPTSTA